MLRIILLIALSTLFLNSCKEPADEPVIETGKLSIQFMHYYLGERVEYDTLRYTNEAGDLMMFSEIQYFVSDVTLHYTNGSTYLINKWKDIHYVDSDIISTQTWEVYDSLPAGNIDSISFTFGINEEKNQSFIYLNPPEVNMFWPDILGGGYHYLKLNGKWKNEQGSLSPFNFHLGIGQIYDNQDNITGFIQNYFRTGAKLPVYSSYALSIRPGETSGIALVMNVDSWFDTPYTWDFDEWGGDIMQNQVAMATACENGRDAFVLAGPAPSGEVVGW
jgi:hypothetical protein